MNRRIVIVGFMGSGKTTIAEALGRKLECDVTDLDLFITEREDRSPAEIIAQAGESEFRNAETVALRDVLENNEAQVIALGGGAWANEANRALVAAHGCLSVWLDAPFELCWERIASSETIRPLAPDRATAAKLYHDRNESYRLSDRRIRVSSDDSPTAMAEKILDR
ncbi:MAG: shikimate kinase [Acidobacteriota bacterium]